MLIERPPRLFRMLFPGALFRVNPRKCGRAVYLTFDDGPIPQATPRILEILDRYGVKATFFMVGDNARRYPELVERVKSRGHDLGNHTMHHVQGAKTSTSAYVANVEEAHKYVPSALFRPPHGWLRPRQAAKIKRTRRIVMYDLVTRDYSRRLSADRIVRNVQRYARPGSVIVFHDSLKSIDKLRTALPQSLEWLIGQGYTFKLLGDEGGR